jgi:hypothetical protein
MTVAITIGLGAALVAVTLLVIVVCDRVAQAGMDELLAELFPPLIEACSPERRCSDDR